MEEEEKRPEVFYFLVNRDKSSLICEGERRWIRPGDAYLTINDEPYCLRCFDRMYPNGLRVA